MKRVIFAGVSFLAITSPANAESLIYHCSGEVFAGTLDKTFQLNAEKGDGVDVDLQQYLSAKISETVIDIEYLAGKDTGLKYRLNRVSKQLLDLNGSSPKPVGVCEKVTPAL